MYTTRLFEEAGQSGGIGWMVWVALAIFFVMVFLGWLASSRGWLRKEEPLVQPHDDHGHDDHGHSSANESHASQAKAADDLTTLEGIGPKVAKLLNGIGIASFEELSNADPGKLRKTLDAAGYKYMEPAGWIDQARLAAKGDAAGLKRLQDSLKGGRKAGK